jgi:low affinity Fe/Cu permease
LSTQAAVLAGKWQTFVVALLLVALWALTGPFFAFSDTWQLIVNTATTISTGLMVFLIQNTQTRDAHAMHLKLDELIRATQGADNQLMEAEDDTDEEMAELKRMYLTIIEEQRELKRHIVGKP